MTTENSQVKALEYPGLSGIAEEEHVEYIQGQEQTQQAEEAKQEAQAADNTAGWLEAVKHAGSMVTAMIPEATPVWNDERLEALAAALARCDEAYGWGGIGGLFGHPLIGLGFASFPLIIGTAKVIKAKAEKSADAAPAGKVDPMGAAAGPAKPGPTSYAWKADWEKSKADATEVRFK